MVGVSWSKVVLDRIFRTRPLPAEPDALVRDPDVAEGSAQIPRVSACWATSEIISSSLVNRKLLMFCQYGLNLLRCFGNSARHGLQ